MLPDGGPYIAGNTVFESLRVKTSESFVIFLNSSITIKITQLSTEQLGHPKVPSVIKVQMSVAV